MNGRAVIRLLSLLLAGGSVPLCAQAPAADEYQIKAAFLFNFAQFVMWPAAAFAAPNAALVIGVLGEDPFGARLDETVAGETVDGHPLVVRRYDRVDEVADAHILFVGAAEPGALERTLARVPRGILTVGDGEAFAERGGMIALVTDRNRIRLAVNLEATQAGEVQLSSRLLRASQIVRGAP